MKYLSKNILLGLLGVFAFTACDDIDEANRIIKGEKEPLSITEEEFTLEVDGQSFTYVNQHRLLIEDFTGWRCVNCPNMAAFLLNNIEAIYPSVVVSLHPSANSLSNTDERPFSLSCTLADEVANTLAGSNVSSSMSLPAVSIDQKPYSGQILQSGDTTTVYNTLRTIAFEQYTRYYIDRKPFANLAINVEKKTDNSYQLSTLIAPCGYNNNVCLQLWLLESGITAYQSTQSGMERNYVNNHVLRLAINGNHGETISLSEDNIVKKHTLSFDGTNYVTENCSVVAIVSDPATYEVINCVEVKL